MSANTPGGIFQVGDVLNNTYRIEKVLGRGGTSEVYRARSEISGRVMAVKALRSELSRNEDFLALMTREEDMREIRHDAVVRYYDNQRTDDGHIYLVMDYVDGPGLDTKIKEGGMSAQDLMIIARRVAEGLVVAHGRKIVHRDLSPDNIILRNGNPAEAVIIDFGIAKDSNPGAETIVGNEFAGKYAYAAPEQLSGQTDERADIYALGALLLAAFRGKAPNAGANPMEVVKRKGEPLDTSGVPEPLKSLIDQMTVPDRDKRISTAQEVLDKIRAIAETPESPAPAPQKPDDDRTVIVPVKKRAPTLPPPQVEPVKDPLEPTNYKTADTSGNGVGFLPILGGLAVLGLVAAMYFTGMFAPFGGQKLPLAAPYTLIAERAQGTPPQLIGYMPSKQAKDDLSKIIAAQGGTSEITLARGDIPTDWSDGVIALIDQIDEQETWKLAVNGTQVSVAATAASKGEADALKTAIASAKVPVDFSVAMTVEVGPNLLPVSALEPTLLQFANCGELLLENPPATGYTRRNQVAITGRVASVGTRIALSDALSELVNGRDLVLDVEVLNPTLCQISSALPDAPKGGFEVVFGFGDRDEINTTGRYFVGENPVIDVVIPAQVSDGFLFVSALDVSGTVFHLLPNLINEENNIATLREGQKGPITVRVAFPLSQAVDGSKLAFKVDNKALGKTQIVVIHADNQVFDGLRPTTESAGGYAQALRGLTGQVSSLDSRILITAEK